MYIPASAPVMDAPAFLELIGHALRWQILQALSQSDLRVFELVERLGRPQNLISYHLHKLLEPALVRERRSRADSREVYYSLDLTRLRQAYFSSGMALHPALAQPDMVEVRPAPGMAAQTVLFLCTHNSARSQMAEAILRSYSAGKIQVFSAGVRPSGLHPLAIEVMSEVNIDIRFQSSKSIELFTGQEFDFFITVCDQAREECPRLPGFPRHLHWSIPDPAAAAGSVAQQRQAFQEARQELINRIHHFLISQGFPSVNPTRFPGDYPNE